LVRGVHAIERFWTKSIRRQLILGIAAVHAVLMSIFVVDMLERQKKFLHDQAIEQTTSLSETLAANSTSWVLANDIIGIEEVVSSQSKYPGLEYAMVLNMEGKVLGHTDRQYIGMYIEDDSGSGFQTIPSEVNILVNTPTLIDVAAPVYANGKQIGWTRVGLGQQNTLAGLRTITRNGLIYTVIAILVGVIFALVMAKGLTQALHKLVELTGRVSRGESGSRAELQRHDEIGRLATNFDSMLDSIAASQAELAESQLRFDLAMRGSSDGLWDRNLLTNEVYLSPRWKEMIGYRDDELENELGAWDRLVHPDDLDKTKNAINNYISGESDSYRVEFRMKHKDGHWVHVLDRGYLVRDENGRAVRMAGTHVDLTERIQNEDKIRRLNSELEDRVHQRTIELLDAKNEAERANSAKSEFLSRMSHELRTPMNAILGFAQLLEVSGDSPLTGEQKESVTEILNAGHHLLELINEVLDLSRIEAGKMVVNMEPVCVQEILRECMSLIVTLAADRGVTVELKEAERENYVLADRTRIKQVLLNLLSNAVKYNSQDGKVVIRISDSGDMWRISIIDTGPGLNEEQKNRLFVPFDRLGADKTKIEGTGIGLALSKKLVACMDGIIDVESSEGSGSTFWVELGKSSVLEMNQAISGDGVAGIEGPGDNSHRILYIEDNYANTRLIQKIIEKSLAGVELITADNPKLGIELAHKHCPDLILLDINLPEMDGYEVMRYLQASRATREIPVVAISANAMPGDISRSKVAGFVDYLTKPVNVPSFLKLVDQVLENSGRQ